MSRSFLIIQTAFTGDVILATSVAEKIHENDSSAYIDILVRKGNETLFKNHPFIRNILTWNKKQNKYGNLISVLKAIRKNKYDTVINLQRFISTGILTAFSASKEKIGFDKNPLSFLFTKRSKHIINKSVHEINRNNSLVTGTYNSQAPMPKLYPTEKDFQFVHPYKEKQFITVSPVSVWFTKTFPSYKWIEIINNYISDFPSNNVYLLGSKDEFESAEFIRSKSKSENVINLCGSLSLLQSAALIKDSQMNFVNDSAPLHLASAMNASVTAVYCSTVPEFGFGPLSANSRVIQTEMILNCKPCGLHGYRECPLVHFKCAHSIDTSVFKFS